MSTYSTFKPLGGLDPTTEISNSTLGTIDNPSLQNIIDNINSGIIDFPITYDSSTKELLIDTTILPTTDPQISGQLWNNGGTLYISLGENSGSSDGTGIEIFYNDGSMSINAKTISSDSGLVTTNGGGILTAKTVVADISTSTVTVGSGSRTLKDKLSEEVSILDYGISTANNNDIGVVINQMISNGITNIYIPPGSWNLRTTINFSNNVTLYGAGGSSIINIMMTSTNSINLTSCSFNTIKNLTFQAGSTRTGGSVIYVNHTFHVVLEHLYFTTGGAGLTHYSGIYCDTANDTHITDCEMRPPTSGYYGGNGITLSGADARTEDTYITNTNISGYNVNLNLIWASGTYISGMDLLSANQYGIQFNPDSTQEIDGFRATMVLADSNSQNGWNIIGQGPITEINLTNCWGATNGSDTNEACGIVLDNTNISNFVINSCEFHANSSHGISIQNGQNIVVTGNTCFMNSRYNVNSFCGIYVNSGASYVLINNNFSGFGGEAVVANSATTGWQKYGIQTVSTDYIQVCNNMTRLNVTGSTNIATGTNVISNNNMGS